MMTELIEKHIALAMALENGESVTVPPHPQAYQSLDSTELWYTSNPVKILAEIDKEIGDNVDELFALMEAMREEKLYQHSDRLRTIIGRLARLQAPNKHPVLVREQARTLT